MLLLCIIGDQESTVIYNIYKVEENINNEKIDSIFETLITKLIPETNIRYERYLFNCMTQEEMNLTKSIFKVKITGKIMFLQKYGRGTYVGKNHLFNTTII
jgi:hypothetical protein